MTAIEKLTELAATPNPLTEINDWDSPVSRVGDWRYFIPDGIADLWDDLPVEAKLVALVMASQIDDPLK